MKTRIITALMLVPILVALLILGNSQLIAVAVSVVSVMGLAEFYKAVGLNKVRLLCFMGCALGAAIPLFPIISKHYLHPETAKLISDAAIYIFVALLLAIMLIRHKKINIKDIGLVIFSLIYIPIFLTNILYIRIMDFGRVMIWLVFIGAFLTDSCAYFVGVFMGKHKLCPEISPKKTIEGAVGGTVGCMVFYILYGLLMKNVFALDINFVKLGVLGLITSIISQMGDLAASIIKRQYGIKDYGTLFPGHGGILDRCDSVILVSPVIYLYLATVGIM